MTRRSPQLAFEAVSIEGGLVTPDFLSLVAELKAAHQAPTDYEVPKGIQIRDEIGRSWQIAVAHWKELEKAAGGPAHERTVLSLLKQAFGWHALDPCAEPVQLDDRLYPVTALAAGGQVPVVVASGGQDLDAAAPRFGDGARRRSAFGLAQEYLNATDRALWGVVTNGAELRVVRDNASLTRPAWIEVDLARIMAEQRYADFSLLWLLLHQSRFAARSGRTHDAILEQWRTEALAAGTAARNRLRDEVEAALRSLGDGFLKHPANTALRQRLSSGDLDAAGYQQQLLRLVYRLIFLLVSEERELLHPPGSDPGAVDAYDEGYSLRRLRERAARRRSHDRHDDAWAGLLVSFRGCAAGEPMLGLPALGGLFAPDQCPDLDGARLGNGALMQAVFRLTWLDQDRSLVRVNWRDMGTEELGSVYESLLELVPRVDLEGRSFGFLGDGTGDTTTGHSRKLTGSYYTPDSLVQALLDTALEPVIERALAAANPELALLSLSVLDPACGSGHFLLGAARRIAGHLARVRSDGTPDPAAYRAALREVVTHCVYGVDKNAMAVELARIALWLEAMEPGKPLAFLDHHLVHGDALLGILDPSVMADGIPDEAFKPLTGDDKETAKALKKENAAQRKALEKARKAGQYTMRFDTESWAARLAQVDAMPDTTLDEVASKEAALRGLWASHEDNVRLACDCFVAAFLLRKDPSTRKAFPTTGTIQNLGDGIPPGAELQAAVRRVAADTPFLHWPITFAPVMARGGFDCVVGNPPWEKLALSEEEFFETRAPEIANAPNGHARKAMIEELGKAAPGSPERRLFDRYEAAVHESLGTSGFAREGGRFPLTGRGIVNLYALFAELGLRARHRAGRAGMVLPSGIASDAGTAPFFRHVADGQLASLIDFENREKLFEAVDSRQKFCLLTIGAAERPQFAFFLTRPEQRFDERRQFTLSAEDLRRLNPNTGTAPIFRSKADAELTAKIYRNVPVLWDETREDGNPWGLEFRQGLFNMTSDSGLFHTEPGPGLVPLYEAKMIHQYDHRFGSFETREDGRGYRVLPDTPLEKYQNPEYSTQPYYWVDASEVESRLEGKWERAWMLAFKDVTAATNERTVVATVIPRVGANHKLPLMLFQPTRTAQEVACLLACLNSMTFDYVARQKVGGLSLGFFILKQLPVPLPSALTTSTQALLIPRVAELTYTANELAEWATDLGHQGHPFPWDPDRRAIVRAEIDAIVAAQFGLSRDDLRFVLDPEEALGEGYPSETFRVLKSGEVDTYGEFRTRRLVLEAWDRLIGSP